MTAEPQDRVRIEGGGAYGRVQVIVGGLLLAFVLFCLVWLAAVDVAVLLHPVIWGLALVLLVLAGASLWMGLRLWSGRRVLLEYDAAAVAVGAALPEAGQPWERLRRVRVRTMYVGYVSPRSLSLAFEVPQRRGSGTTDRAAPVRWRTVDISHFDRPADPQIEALLDAARAAGCVVLPPTSVYRGLWGDRVWQVRPPGP